MTIIPNPIRRVFEAILAPLVGGLIKAKVSPNLLTTIGTGILLGSGVAFGLGLAHWGGALLLLSGVMDMLDGRVAHSCGVDVLGRDIGRLGHVAFTLNQPRHRNTRPP